MFDVSRTLFVYSINACITIVALISIRELPTDDILVNINKGYSLQRIGAYSTNMIEEVVHTFVPLDNFCAVQTTDAVCVYTSSPTKINIIELATTITSHHARDTSFTHDKESVSKSIAKDLSRVLLEFKPNEFLQNTESNVHFLNNQFHYQKNDNNVLRSTSPVSTVDNSNDILRFRATSADIIIKQINSNTIGFEHLYPTDLKLFLTSIFSKIDDSYKVNNVEESLNAFSQLVVGQSVYALRFCALSRQDSLSSKPCLAISTLFIRIPTNSPSTYLVYRLLPLPIVVDGDRYIYSDLPKVIGINAFEQTLIMWNNELDTNECTFSPIVLCHTKPVSLSLSKSSCLSQLIDDYQSITSICQVSRSPNIEQGIFYIDDDLWLFYNINRTHYCQIYSNSNKFTQTISINEPALVRIPCDKSIICPDFQLPAASCKANRVTITPSLTFKIQNLPHFIMPIKNMTQMLVSIHRIQLENSIKKFILPFSRNQSTFQETFRDYAMYVLSLICGIFIMISIYIIKLIKYKMQRAIQELDSQIQDIINF